MNNEIILENVAPDENPAQPNHNNDNPDHALTDKIARLPMPSRKPIRVNSHNSRKRAKTIKPFESHPRLVKPAQAAPLGGGARFGD
jgi:hypothetical protein